MSYHVATNGKQSGPHTDAEVQALLARGELKTGDLCWREGWANWRPVAEAFGSAALAPAGAMPPAAYMTHSAADAANTAQDDAMTEAIRREHLTHEASIQGIGSLYCLGGVIIGLMAVATLVGVGAAGRESGAAAGTGVGVATVLGAVAVLQFWVGLGLRRLNPKVTIPATILSAIGLFGFPIGTLINGYILYLLHSKKGKVVLGEGYREIVAATPHIRYKTPVWLIVLVVVIVLLVVGAIVAATVSS